MAILPSMIILYADLVEDGVRTLDQTSTTIKPVPLKYVPYVQAELERRKNGQIQE